MYEKARSQKLSPHCRQLATKQVQWAQRGQGWQASKKRLPQIGEPGRGTQQSTRLDSQGRTHWRKLEPLSHDEGGETQEARQSAQSSQGGAQPG